jgi:hypothetical protein
MHFPFIGAFAAHPQSGDQYATIVALGDDGGFLEWMTREGVVAREFAATDAMRPVEVPLPLEVFCQLDEDAPDSWVVASITHQHQGEDGQVYWKAEGAGINDLVSGARVRFGQALERVDVLSAAANGQFDTPRTYQVRREFLDEYQAQFKVARGLTAMLSAPIDLYEHQLEVVDRILTDPIPKFVLADEVGLGKTIEAGIVLK